MALPKKGLADRDQVSHRDSDQDRDRDMEVAKRLKVVAATRVTFATSILASFCWNTSPNFFTEISHAKQQTGQDGATDRRKLSWKFIVSSFRLKTLFMKSINYFYK